MEESRDCPICGAEYCGQYPADARDGRQMRCGRCGEFFISGTLLAGISNYRDDAYKISAWIRSANESKNGIPELDTLNIKEIINNFYKHGIEEVKFLILSYLLKQTTPNGYGHAVNIDPYWDYPLFYLQGPDELSFHIKELADKKLIESRVDCKDDDIIHCVIMEDGIKYVEQRQGMEDSSAERIERDMCGYIEELEFKKSHPDSYAKWQEARKLFATGEKNQFTAVGHHAREAMQHFADELIQIHKVPDPPKRADNTVERLRHVLKPKMQGKGQREKDFFEALVNYWGVISDLVQRQEHGALKEGEPLTEEDARRVVFHSLVVMFEVHKVFSR